ncbi:MAG: hypothetical protein WA361_00545 [Candidatus Acidiferrales bacterium]
MASRQLDDVEVVATDIAKRLIRRLHLVARQGFQFARLERLLDLSRGDLVGFQLRLADKF